MILTDTHRFYVGEEDEDEEVVIYNERYVEKTIKRIKGSGVIEATKTAFSAFGLPAKNTNTNANTNANANANANNNSASVTTDVSASGRTSPIPTLDSTITNQVESESKLEPELEPELELEYEYVTIKEKVIDTNIIKRKKNPKMLFISRAVPIGLPKKVKLKQKQQKQKQKQKQQLRYVRCKM